MNRVEIKNLNKKYANFALEDINFSIPNGYVTGFIGKNGMGKTTTIKSIISLNHYEGSVSFSNTDLHENFNNQKIGVIMDDSFLAKDWNMILVNKAMKVGYDNWNEELFNSYLVRFNIDKKMKVKELSRGMKIKLMLAIALSHQAELLVLDEPTSGLDPSMREEFCEIISEYMEDDNHTVLFSTHITQDLESIADYIVFIDEGKIILSLEKDEFLEYFKILKCDLERQNIINESAVLGKKINQHSVEFLVKADEMKEVPDKFIEDKVSIDRIMVLYGRKK
ncbi:TPA: ABC transporter ATP-binding protein [Streptococcus equi subsp. zooepidemicus]|nr:ABC transporter ATP-binding protein [Streptococcus equi subsp. zooepidemicus]HEL0514042.1 ABC transporter ATP-binding protein [Streptococcus equi subsp. zooepidemicus]HEL0518075.1 ABC transporter ATP-binding protein [Streptococcus equi subsp. zooepidemicus]